MIELLPCPFCGGTSDEDNACQMAKVVTRSFKSAIGKTAYKVSCGCGAEGPSDLVWGKANSAWNTRPPSLVDREALPKPETMLAYASFLEKPQYNIKDGVRYKIPTGEVIEGACAALRYCAALSSTTAERGAGRASIIQECADVVGEMRQSEAGIFDAKHSGQRGEDRSNALYDAYQAIRKLKVSHP